MAKAGLPQLPISKLQIGITVKLPLSWTNHPFLLNQFEITEAAQIEMIKGLGLPYVFLVSGKEIVAKAEAEDKAKQNTQQEEAEKEPDIQSETKKAMRVSQQRFIKSINQNRDMFSKIASDPEGSYRASSALVEDMYSQLKEFEHPLLAMVSSGDNDISITQHGVSVAVLSMMIANALDLPANDVRDVALGALFHDIGKLKVPDAIRRKRGELNEHEQNYLNMHPKFGFDLLDKSGLFPPAVLKIVLQHHEYLDGSGFPEGLKASKIPITSQIVSLANDYERLLSSMDSPSPQVALGFLFKNRAGKHAESLVAVLVKILGIYPPGTLVKLDDGSVGKVMMTTQEVKQPQVWACEPNGKEPKLRFLVDEGVQIATVIKVEELTEAAQRVLKADAGISFYFSSMPTIA